MTTTTDERHCAQCGKADGPEDDISREWGHCCAACAVERPPCVRCGRRDRVAGRDLCGACTTEVANHHHTYSARGITVAFAPNIAVGYALARLLELATEIVKSGTVVCSGERYRDPGGCPDWLPL